MNVKTVNKKRYINDGDGDEILQEPLRNEQGKGTHIWLSTLLRQAGFEYDDTCFCKNCSLLCDMIDGDAEKRLTIVMEEIC